MCVGWVYHIDRSLRSSAQIEARLLRHLSKTEPRHTYMFYVVYVFIYIRMYVCMYVCMYVYTITAIILYHVACRSESAEYKSYLLHIRIDYLLKNFHS